VRRSTTVLEDFPSPSSLPSQFDILVSDSGYESDKVELSATVVRPPVITKFDQSNCTMAPKSGVITRFETCRSCKEFSPSRQRPIMSRQQPIMSRERFIMTSNYVPKFEHNGNYVPRSTALYKPSMASSTAMQQVVSVRTCHSSTEHSYVNTSARDEVALPRSNLYPDARRIGMGQSGGRIYYQAARTSFSQSQPSIHTTTDQSVASNPGSSCYKRHCRGQFVSSVVSNSTAASRNTLSSIGHRRKLQQSNKPVRCVAPISQRSNTPVRWKPIAGANYQSNSWIRRQEARPSQLSNVPVRHQPSLPNSTSMPLLWSFWSTCLRKRQIRRRRFQRNNLTYALYVATRLWHLPLIGNICYRFIGWMWSGLLWCTRKTSTRTRGPNSTDN